MKKPECYSGDRGLKSFLGKTQQINKNEKEKDTQNYRTHGHLLTVDITVAAGYIYALIFECIYSKINVLRPEGKVCGSKTDDVNGVRQITGGYSK